MFHVMNQMNKHINVDLDSSPPLKANLPIFQTHLQSNSQLRLRFISTISQVIPQKNSSNDNVIIVSLFANNIQDILQRFNTKEVDQQYCNEVSNYLNNSQNQNFAKLIHKIPVMKDYYAEILEKLFQARLSTLLQNIQIFKLLFSNLYKSIFQRKIEDCLLQKAIRFSQNMTKGYQRIAILYAYLPQQCNITQILIQKCQNMIKTYISQQNFIFKLIEEFKQQQSHEFQEETSLDQQQQKQYSIEIQQNQSQIQIQSNKFCNKSKKSFIEIIYRIMKTMLFNCVQIDIINQFLNHTLMKQLNSQLQHHSSEQNCILLQLLSYITKFNAHVFWQHCEVNQQFLQRLIVEQHSKLNDYELPKNYFHIEYNPQQYIQQILINLNELKLAHNMINRIIEFIIGQRITFEELKLMNQLILNSNKLCYDVYKYLFSYGKIKQTDNILDILKSKRHSKSFYCECIKLIKTMIYKNYYIDLDLLEEFLKYINSINRGIIKGVLCQLQKFLEERLQQNSQDEQKKQYYECCLSLFQNNI